MRGRDRQLVTALCKMVGKEVEAMKALFNVVLLRT